LYKKIVKRAKKYHAHDENNSYKKGDTVTIQETKPISKLKSWIAQEIAVGGDK
jgi:small subunit ribosomal protein S17